MLAVAIDVESASPLIDVLARAGQDLPAVGLALLDDRGDLLVGIVEDLAQQEDRPLDRRQRLEQHHERDRQRIGELGRLRGVALAGGDQRLGKPRAEIALAPSARGAQLVDRQPLATACATRWRASM